MAAVETYNKVSFPYKEQTFVLLMANAWELLLKARLLQQNDDNEEAIFRQDKRTGEFEVHRETGDKMTISVREALNKLQLNTKVVANVEILLHLRNNVIHIATEGSELNRGILAYGSASVQNFVRQSTEWFAMTPRIPYLLPMGFLGTVDIVAAPMTASQKQLLIALNRLAKEHSTPDGSGYEISLNMGIKLNPDLSGGSTIGVTNDPSATEVQLNDHQLFQLFPMTHAGLIVEAKKRYKNFKQDQRFNAVKDRMHQDPACTYHRRLNPSKPTSGTQRYYNREVALSYLDKVFEIADDDTTL